MTPPARVRAVGEETLLLIRREEERTASDERRLPLIARGEGDAAVLEFIAATDETNLEDQMALLGDRAMSGLLEQEVSLRLLRRDHGPRGAGGRGREVSRPTPTPELAGVFSREQG